MTLKLAFVLPIVLIPLIAVAQPSRKGGYHAQTEFEARARSYPGHNMWRATIMSSAGKGLYSLKKEIPYDVGFPAVYVSDLEGRTILVSSFAGKVEYYDGSGRQVRSLLPFGKETAVFEQKIVCSVAGTRAAFLISSPELQNAVLFVTDMNGAELWRAALPEQHAAEVFLSDDMQYVLAGSFSSGEGGAVESSHLFDGTGKLLRRFDSNYRHADIDQETKMLALTNRGNVFLTSIDGSKSAKWSSDSPTRIVTGVRFFSGYCAIVAERINAEDRAFGVSYNDPQLVVTDMRGQPVFTRKLLSSSHMPALLRVERSRITVRTDKAFMRISRSELK